MGKKNKERGLTRRTLGGLFWTSSGSAIESGLQILVTIVLARLLSPADFGLVATAGIFVGFCQIFANLGVGPAIIQRSNLANRHLRTGFTISVLFGIFFSALIFFLAPYIARFFRMPNLVPYLWVVAPAFIIRGLSLVAESLLRRELKFRILAKVQVLSFVIGSTIVAITLAWLGFGAGALILGQLAETTFSSVSLLILRPHPKRLSINRRAFWDLVTFGGWMTVSRIGNFLALRGDYMITGRWLGAAALGFYTRAYSLLAAPANLFAAIGDKVLFPSMSKIQHEPDRLATAFRRGTVLISLVTLPTSAIFFVLAPEIVAILFGPKWLPVVAPLQILSLGIYFRIAYKVSGILARAKGTVFYLALIQLLYAGFVVAGAWLGQFYGIEGIAVGVLVALILHYGLMTGLSLKYLPISTKQFVYAHLPALLLTLVACSVSIVTASVLRSFFTNPLLILLGTIVAILVAGYPLIRVTPGYMLGEDGLWWLRTLTQNLQELVHRVKKRDGNTKNSAESEPVRVHSLTFREDRSEIKMKD